MAADEINKITEMDIELTNKYTGSGKFNY